MNLKDFEKRKAAIWAKYEREYGSLIAQEIRDRIDGEIIRLSRNDPETLDDLDGYLSSNIPIWKTILLKGETSAARDSAKAKPTKRYRKCFERRFYLVNFVMDRPYKRGTRIDWKPMVTEWNKSNHSDQMSLSSLRVAYQRAIIEDPLMLQVRIIRGGRFLTGLWQQLENKLRDMQKYAPMSYALASLVGQRMRDDTQPIISSLIESIKNSPKFKEIEAQNPEQTARLESELEAIANSGDLKPLVEEAGEKTGNSDKVRDDEAEKPG